MTVGRGVGGGIDAAGLTIHTPIGVIQHLHELTILRYECVCRTVSPSPSRCILYNNIHMDRFDMTQRNTTQHKKRNQHTPIETDQMNSPGAEGNRDAYTGEAIRLRAARAVRSSRVAIEDSTTIETKVDECILTPMQSSPSPSPSRSRSRSPSRRLIHLPTGGGGGIALAAPSREAESSSHQEDEDDEDDSDAFAESESESDIPSQTDSIHHHHHQQRAHTHDGAMQKPLRVNPLDYAAVAAYSSARAPMQKITILKPQPTSIHHSTLSPIVSPSPSPSSLDGRLVTPPRPTPPPAVALTPIHAPAASPQRVMKTALATRVLAMANHEAAANGQDAQAFTTIRPLSLSPFLLAPQSAVSPSLSYPPPASSPPLSPLPSPAPLLSGFTIYHLGYLKQKRTRIVGADSEVVRGEPGEKRFFVWHSKGISVYASRSDYQRDRKPIKQMLNAWHEKYRPPDLALSDIELPELMMIPYTRVADADSASLLRAAQRDELLIRLVLCAPSSLGDSLPPRSTVSVLKGSSSSDVKSWLNASARVRYEGRRDRTRHVGILPTIQALIDDPTGFLSNHAEEHTELDTDHMCDEREDEQREGEEKQDEYDAEEETRENPFVSAATLDLPLADDVFSSAPTPTAQPTAPRDATLPTVREEEPDTPTTIHRERENTHTHSVPTQIRPAQRPIDACVDFTALATTPSTLPISSPSPSSAVALPPASPHSCSSPLSPPQFDALPVDDSSSTVALTLGDPPIRVRPITSVNGATPIAAAAADHTASTTCQFYGLNGETPLFPMIPLMSIERFLTDSCRTAAGAPAADPIATVVTLAQLGPRHCTVYDLFRWLVTQSPDGDNQFHASTEHANVCDSTLDPNNQTQMPPSSSLSSGWSHAHLTYAFLLYRSAFIDSLQLVEWLSDMWLRAHAAYSPHRAHHIRANCLYLIRIWIEYFRRDYLTTKVQVDTLLNTRIYTDVIQWENQRQRQEQDQHTNKHTCTRWTEHKADDRHDDRHKSIIPTCVHLFALAGQISSIIALSSGSTLSVLSGLTFVPGHLLVIGHESPAAPEGDLTACGPSTPRHARTVSSPIARRQGFVLRVGARSPRANGSLHASMPTQTSSTTPTHAPAELHSQSHRPPHAFAHRASSLLFLKKFVSFHSASSLMAISPLMIAHELTNGDVELLQCIHTRELVSKVWTSRDAAARQAQAGSVITFIESFNRRSFWVATEIFKAGSTNDTGIPSIASPDALHLARVDMVAHFIRVAVELIGLNNYYSAFALLNGITLQPIFRIKSIWTTLPPTAQSQLRHIQSLLSSQGNFSRYRSIHKDLTRAGAAHVPHFAVLIKDLFQLEELPTWTNSTAPKHESNHTNNEPTINWAKFAKQYCEVHNTLLVAQTSLRLYEQPQARTIDYLSDIRSTLVGSGIGIGVGSASPKPSLRRIVSDMTVAGSQPTGVASPPTGLIRAPLPPSEPNIRMAMHLSMQRIWNEEKLYQFSYRCQPKTK